MEPSVTMVCLYADQPHFLPRLMACFRSQTYRNKYLLIYDNGAVQADLDLQDRERVVWQCTPKRRRSIGDLRNAANGYVETEIIVHGDLDDWSHPNRIAEQVVLLRSSGKECVGYRDMLFWDTRPGQFCGAWFYSDGRPAYCLGTSLCYWRRVWIKRRFDDLPKLGNPLGASEDTMWLAGVDSLGVASTYSPESPLEPRMIASVSERLAQNFPLMIKAGDVKRAPEFDEYCRSRMVL